MKSNELLHWTSEIHPFYIAQWNYLSCVHARHNIPRSSVICILKTQLRRPQIKQSIAPERLWSIFHIIKSQQCLLAVEFCKALFGFIEWMNDATLFLEKLRTHWWLERVGNELRRVDWRLWKGVYKVANSNNWRVGRTWKHLWALRQHRYLQYNSS